MAMAVSSAPAYAQAEDEEIEEVIITGSRIARRDFTSPSPVATVSAQEFKLTGSVNVEQMLNTLPQVVPGLTNTTNNPGNGTASVDLRGLGTNRTLVLVNGRRFVPSSQDGTVDVNNIPASLIDRVEVVTGGASAVYGSDALAGVVNFIMKDDFEGVQVDVQYQVTERGDGDIWDVSMTMGGNFGDGRGNVVAFASYNFRDAVMQGDRGFSFFALQDGGGGTELVRGGSYGLPQTGVIEAIDFSPGPNIDFGGVFNTDGTIRSFRDPEDRFNYAPFNFLQLPMERWNITTMGSYEVNDYIEAYMEATFVNARVPQELAPTPAFFTAEVNTDNPFLAPQAQDIFATQLDADGDGIATFFIGRRMLEVGPRQVINERNAWRMLFGARGELGDNWNWDAYYLFNRISLSELLNNDVSQNRFQQALFTTDGINCLDPSGGCVPLNIFGEGNISEAAANFVRVGASNITTLQEQVVSGSVAGQLMELPSGPLGVAVGFEYRAERSKLRNDEFLKAGDVLGFNAGLDNQGNFDVSELYGEVVIPIVTDAPMAEYIGIEGGFRYSDYSTAGTVWTYKYGGEWVVGSGFKLRGLFQRAVRAPSVIELFGGTSQNFPGFTDPCDASQPRPQAVLDLCLAQGVPAAVLDGFIQQNSQVESRSSGNPDLNVEKSDTFTVGAVWQPDFTDLSVSLDYYSIDIGNAIALAGGGGPGLLNLCFQSLENSSPFCRALRLEADPASRGQRLRSGQIDFIKVEQDNIANLVTAGLDLAVDYTMDLEGFGFMGNPASLNWFFLGTRVIENSFKATSLAPSIECAGFFGAPCGNTIGGAADPDWKLNTRVTYMSGPLTASLRWRWMNSVDDARISQARAQGDEIPTVPTNYPAQSYFDLSLIYNIGENYTFNAGVINLFDNSPPLAGTQQVQANTDPSVYDVLGRRFFFNAVARF